MLIKHFQTRWGLDFLFFRTIIQPHWVFDGIDSSQNSCPTTKRKLQLYGALQVKITEHIAIINVENITKRYGSCAALIIFLLRGGRGEHQAPETIKQALASFQGKQKGNKENIDALQKNKGLLPAVSPVSFSAFQKTSCCLVPVFRIRQHRAGAAVPVKTTYRRGDPETAVCYAGDYRGGQFGVFSSYFPE